MKHHLLILMVVAGMILFISGTVLGAVHDSGGDFPDLKEHTFDLLQTGTWYSIEKDSPYWLSFDSSRNTASVSGLGLKYYQNDQFFGEAAYTIVSGEIVPVYRGSYLLDNGFFVGLESDVEDYHALAPGYRYNFDARGYIAFSFDFLTFSGYNYTSYDLDFKYFPDRMKILGQYYHDDGGDSLYLAANFKATDTLVCGAEIFAGDSDTNYSAGLTWTPSKFIVDGEIGVQYGDNFYDLSGMYLINGNLSAGLEFMKAGSDDSLVTYKFKHTGNGSSFALAFTPDYDSSIHLVYSVEL